MRGWLGVWLMFSTAGCGDVPLPAASSDVDGVEDLDGQPREPLATDQRADLLVFVRSDCPISNRQAPKLARLAEEFAAEPIDVWLIYVDPDETAAVIREHVADFGLPGTPLRDPEQVLARRGQITRTPEVALFDADGALRYHGRIDDAYVDYGKSRPPTHHELRDAILTVLAGELPAVDHAAAVGCPLPPLGALLWSE